MGLFFQEEQMQKWYWQNKYTKQSNNLLKKNFDKQNFIVD